MKREGGRFGLGRRRHVRCLWTILSALFLVVVRVSAQGTGGFTFIKSACRAMAVKSVVKDELLLQFDVVGKRIQNNKGNVLVWAKIDVIFQSGDTPAACRVTAHVVAVCMPTEKYSTIQ